MADGTHHYQAAMSVTVTSTGNIDNLDVDGVGMLLMNNASAAVIRGIDAGYHGQRLVIAAVGAGSVTLNHQDTNSSAANRLVTPIAAAMPILLALLTYDGVNARWRVTAVTTNGQVQFPATQNASTDANTLDDYEEGTWTPTITGSGGSSGQVYSSQDGYYEKIGRQVTVYFRVVLSTLGTITGNAQIGGLPFTSANLTNYRATGNLQWSSMTSALYVAAGQIAPNVTVINLLGLTAAGTGIGSLVQADFSNTSVIAGSITYSAAS